MKKLTNSVPTKKKRFWKSDLNAPNAQKTPAHVGFIMDGNGRWATARGLKRSDGYAAGLNALFKVLKRSKELEIPAVTVFAFSTENNSRPTEEIDAIFSLVEKFNLSYDGDTRITYIGDFSSLPYNLCRSIDQIEAKTADYKGTILNIAFNYGSRDDIIHAAKVCYDHGVFTDELFESALGSAHLPPLDCIVRTGGEMRLSNFMLYECAYAELIFLNKLWPDMTEEDVDKVLQLYSERTRKFGA